MWCVVLDGEVVVGVEVGVMVVVGLSVDEYGVDVEWCDFLFLLGVVGVVDVIG